MASTYQVTLEAARVNRKMTQEQAGQAIGVSRETIQNWETGKTYPAYKFVQKICEVYAVPLDALIFCE